MRIESLLLSVYAAETTYWAFSVLLVLHHDMCNADLQLLARSLDGAAPVSTALRSFLGIKISGEMGGPV